MRAVIVLFLFFSTALKAQDTTDSQLYKNVRAQAHAYAENLFVYRNYTYTIAHTYPLIVQEYGGAEKMKEALKKGLSNFDKLDSENIIYDVDVAAGIPAKIVDTAQQLQCIVPDTMIVSIITKQTIEKTAGAVPLIGISEDGGNTWYFCFQGGSGYEKMKENIPTLSSQLIFLPVKKP